MKIKVIIPNSGMAPEVLRQREQMLLGFASPGTEISVDCIAGGPKSIESDVDETYAGPYILEKVLQAKKEKCDALIIYCGSDPAVNAARELVSFPVIGPGKLSKLVAQDLGNRFAILTVLDSTVARDTESCYRCGVNFDRLASVRSIQIPVALVQDDAEATYKALETAGRACIEQDGAHCLVLSCLGMAGMGERLTRALGVPVIDPAPLAIRYAEMLHTCKLSHSLVSYPHHLD